MKRTDIINTFIRDRGFRRYLEIGVAGGFNLDRVQCENKTGVDPSPTSKATIHETSDIFFGRAIQAGIQYDIVFIDGLHQDDQVYRDITNALRCLSPGGVVVLHDCLPWSEYVASHQPHGGAWCGDVYKAVARYFAESRYLCYTVDDDCGCGVIDTSAENVVIPESRPCNLAALDYAQFTANRNRLMHVVTGDEFTELVQPSASSVSSVFRRYL